MEGVDKLLTFLFVGALGACSDGVGRKPLIALSALGYATTVLVHRATKVAHFFAADAIDGLTCLHERRVCGLRRRRHSPGMTWAPRGGARRLPGALGRWSLHRRLPDGCYIIEGWQVPQAHVPGGFVAITKCVPGALRHARERPQVKGIKWDEANPISSLGQLDLFKKSTPLKKTAIAFSLVWLGNLRIKRVLRAPTSTRSSAGARSSPVLCSLL